MLRVIEETLQKTGGLHNKVWLPKRPCITMNPSDKKKCTTDTEKGDFLKLSQDLQTEDVLLNI